jgi:hypothetical protein
VQPPQVDRLRQALGIGVVLAADGERADHGSRRRLVAGPEMLAIGLHHLVAAAGLMKCAKANAMPSCAARAPL